jgi:hypothetical protein
MWFVLALIRPLLLSLLRRLIARERNKKGLTERERYKIDTVIARALQIRQVGVRLGCEPEGFDEDGFA